MTNENKEITISAEYLRLAQLFASKEDARYYLKGVNVEPHPSGAGVLIVATDGHVMGIFYDREGYVPESMLIAFDKGLISALKSEKSERCGRIVTVRGGRLTVMTKDIEGNPLEEKYIKPGNIKIDGTFPQWRMVLPAEFEPCYFAINPKLLKPFEIVASALGGKNPGVHFRTTAYNGPIEVTIANKDFYGVIMPMKCDWVSQTTADWLD